VLTFRIVFGSRSASPRLSSFHGGTSPAKSAFVRGLVALTVLVAAGFGIYSLMTRTGPQPFRDFTVTQITNTGRAERAAISPDGKYIRHVQNENGMGSIARSGSAGPGRTLCALCGSRTVVSGIGMVLLSAARACLFGLGFRNAVLWVLAGNVRVDGFYRVDQWVPDGLRRTDSLWGVTVDEVRYRRGL
jgi:hypothetical protein